VENIAPFSGFSEESIVFLRDIRQNNNKMWFEQNRFVFDNTLMKEARSFVVSMGDRLRTIAPELIAEPKTDRSIFRFHRDTRFSKDKSPYKTHLGIYFWEGPFKKVENSGFYFQLEPSRVFLGTGIHMFNSTVMQAYRDAVVDPKLGASLLKAIGKVKAHPEYDMGWIKYKRTPRGYDPEHPNADLLLHGGLGFQYEEPVSDRIHSASFLDDVYKRFEDMSPIHRWLMQLV
jgi:uncharacterized protein (TIGR02453 family)